MTMTKAKSIELKALQKAEKALKSELDKAYKELSKVLHLPTWDRRYIVK